MLRAAVKYGISKALSTHRGVEVWDFEIKESGGDDGRTGLEIRYRYHPECIFAASITGREAGHGISVDVVPGELRYRETFEVADANELFGAVERWSGRLEEELLARPMNRVLVAQHKALAGLEKHLAAIPERPIAPKQIGEYRRRLDQLEAVVVAMRDDEDDLSEHEVRVAEIQEIFESLRARAAVLDERSFLHAVLVRLVMCFWDETNLRIVEAGREAVQQFLAGRRAQAEARIDADIEVAVETSEPTASRIEEDVRQMVSRS